MDVDVLKALSSTNKGQIKYDRFWFEDGNLQRVLEECSAAPKVQPLSPHSANTTPSGISRQHTETETDRKPTSEEEHGTPNISVVTMKVTPVDKMISDVQESYGKAATEKVESRKKLFNSHTAMLLQQAENQLMELYLRQEKDAETVIQQARQMEQLRNEEVKKKQLKLREDHKKHAKHLDARLQEAYRKKREDELVQQQRESESQEKIDHMTKRLQEINTLAISLEKSVADFKFQQHLPESVKTSSTVIGQIREKIGRVIVEASQSEADKSHVAVVDELSTNTKQMIDFVSRQLLEAQKKGEVEASVAKEKQKQLDEQKQLQQQKQEQIAAAEAQATVLSQDDVAQLFQTSQDLLEKVQKSYEPLLTASMKKYKFDLQKAINIPVNAISRVGGAHLRDKLQKVCNLLSRQSVDIGNKKVSVATHPTAYDFCKDLFAKKIVKQGDEQVSSNHESAFPMAAVALGVWCEFPDVGELLLAHFYQACPYILPYYIPKKDGQPSEDYYRALGYSYNGGELEKQDKFLKRMSGMMRLYASLMVCTPPRGQGHPHPHGVQHAWLWLARVMNFDPRPDITATLIYDLLEVTGNALFKTYSKQFVKLLHVLYSEYLPKIRALNAPGGPVMRLEGFLDKVIQRSNIDSPKGILPPNFWWT